MQAFGHHEQRSFGGAGRLLVEQGAGARPAVEGSAKDGILPLDERAGRVTPGRGQVTLIPRDRRDWIRPRAVDALAGPELVRRPHRPRIARDVAPALAGGDPLLRAADGSGRPGETLMATRCARTSVTDAVTLDAAREAVMLPAAPRPHD